MKNFVSLRIIALAFIAAFITQVTCADASVTFLGVAAGDATTDDATVWTRAKDESSPGPTAINAQITTDPTFTSGVTTLLAGTADAPTDYTVKTNVAGLHSATVYYYRFQTLDAGVTSNVGKFKTAPDANAKVAVHFAVSGDCDGLIRPYALASQVPAKNLDFFMFDGDTEYETSASIGSPAVHSTGNIPDPTVIVATATDSQLFTDFSRKYREQFLLVNVGGQNCLQPFFAGQGNYTAYDNHELGNKQYINGGAPAGLGVGSLTGMPPFDFMTGAGVDARVSSNDVTPNDGSVPFMNKSGGFQRLQQVFENYQPMTERGVDKCAGGSAHERHSSTLLRSTMGQERDPHQYRLPQLSRHSDEDCRKCRRHRPSRRQSRPHNARCDAACVAGANASRRAAWPANMEVHQHFRSD